MMVDQNCWSKKPALKSATAIPTGAFVMASAPSGLVDAASGAKITSTSNNPRQIQLVLRFIF